MVAVDPTLLIARNNILDINPPVALNNMTTDGSNWAWAVMALHALFFLIVLALTMKAKVNGRVLHYLALGILFLTTISWYTMASNLGSTPVAVEFNRDGLAERVRTRQIFWVRWVENTLTFALEVIAVMLISGIGWITILFTVGWVWVFTVMHLVGALTFSSYKWGYFAFGVLAWAMIAFHLLVVAVPFANRFEVKKFYFPLAAWLVGMYLIYPIAWGVSEAGNQIANDSEHIFYGILDIITKGFFALALAFWAAKSLDYKRINIWMHDHGRVSPYSHDGVHHEKHRLGHGRDSGVGYDAYDGRASTTAAPAATAARV